MSSSGNIEVYTLSDSGIETVITNNDNTPFDLTGCILIMTVKRRLSDPDSEALVQKRVTVFVDVDGNPSATLGIAMIDFDHDDTDQCPGKYVYDVKIIKDGKSIPTQNGVFEFIESATNAIS